MAIQHKTSRSDRVTTATAPVETTEAPAVRAPERPADFSDIIVMKAPEPVRPGKVKPVVPDAVKNAIENAYKDGPQWVGVTGWDQERIALFVTLARQYSRDQGYRLRAVPEDVRVDPTSENTVPMIRLTVSKKDANTPPARRIVDAVPTS